MPLIQGGPPEWIWERTPNLLRWDVLPSSAPDGHPLYELRVQCGLEIMRLQFLTLEEIKELRAVLDGWANGNTPEPVRPTEERQSETASERSEGERPPRRDKGVVSDPDFAAKR